MTAGYNTLARQGRPARDQGRADGTRSNAKRSPYRMRRNNLPVPTIFNDQESPKEPNRSGQRLQLETERGATVSYREMAVLLDALHRRRRVFCLP